MGKREKLLLCSQAIASHLSLTLVGLAVLMLGFRWWYPDHLRLLFASVVAFYVLLYRLVSSVDLPRLIRGSLFWLHDAVAGLTP